MNYYSTTTIVLLAIFYLLNVIFAAWVLNKIQLSESLGKMSLASVVISTVLYITITVMVRYIE